MYGIYTLYCRIYLSIHLHIQYCMYRYGTSRTCDVIYTYSLLHCKNSVQFLRFLEKNWKVIRDEGVALFDATKGAFVAEEEGLREKGDWQQFTMFQQGRKDHGACNKAPETCKLVEKISDAAGCKRGQVCSMKNVFLHREDHRFVSFGCKEF